MMACLIHNSILYSDLKLFTFMGWPIGKRHSNHKFLTCNTQVRELMNHYACGEGMEMLNPLLQLCKKRLQRFS